MPQLTYTEHEVNEIQNKFAKQLLEKCIYAASQQMYAWPVAGANESVKRLSSVLSEGFGEYLDRETCPSDIHEAITTKYREHFFNVIKRKVECPSCDGGGYVDDGEDSHGDCPDCNGTGFVTK